MDKPEIPFASTGPSTLQPRVADTTAPDRWRRLQELFDGLVARAPAERVAWLAAQPDEEPLKREALRLTDVDALQHDAVIDALSTFAADVPTPPRAGRLGAWRLLQEIGSGGMGTVFLAERADETFDQRVAIKLLRGIPTRESTERMRRERQILADLAHPNIARLLDGGSTPDGQPYLVMEHVDGVPLDVFCRQRKPSLPERLRLVQKLCAAVQYAHQRLVVHRDLKAANVLVRPDGEPVLLDFGVAKLLGETAAPQLTGAPWFTPAYASPEQLRREHVGTAADVYALGALLYEVLTDTPPAPDAEGRLPPPSRGAPRVADRELDLIVARATHPEQERRYASAAALAEDLQRYLRGRPVHAAPDSVRYRTAKFLRRHRIATAAVLAATALAALFAWQLARERDRALRAEAAAHRQTETAENVVDYLVSLFRQAAPDATGTRPIAPRDLVDRGRREIDQRLADAPRQRARLLASLGRIYLELGLIDESHEAIAKAVELERRHGEPRELAAYLSDQGFTLLLSERPAPAIPVLREAIEMLGFVAPGDRKLASEILSMLGTAQLRTGDLAAAEENARRSLDYAAAADGVRSIAYARCLHALAEIEMRGDRLRDAERDSEQALAIMREHLPEDSSDVIGANSFLAMTRLHQGRYAESERLFRHIVEMYLHTLSAGSSWTVVARNNLAQSVQAQGRIDEASALLRENLELMRAARREDTQAYVIGLNNLAGLLEQRGDVAGALAMFREAYERASRQPERDGNPRLPLIRQNLGRALLLNRQPEAARPLLEAAVEGDPRSRDANDLRGRRQLNLSEWMRLAGRADEALRQADGAVATFAALFPERNLRQGAPALARGLALRDLGRLDEAEAELRRAADVYAGSIGRDANLSLEAELHLADLLLARGRTAEARALLERMAPLLPARFAEGAAVPTRHAALVLRLRAH